MNIQRRLPEVKEGTIADCVARFLLQYRVTPHTTTGRSPAELLFGRNIRTRLHAICPDLSRTVERKQQQQKRHRDQRSKTRVDYSSQGLCEELLAWTTLVTRVSIEKCWTLLIHG